MANPNITLYPKFPKGWHEFKETMDLAVIRGIISNELAEKLCKLHLEKLRFSLNKSDTMADTGKN